MKEFKRIYAEYRKIIASYQGSRTDWAKACSQLSALANELNCVYIRCSKNSTFYNWVKQELRKEISDECIRTMGLSFKKKEVVFYEQISGYILLC